MSTGAKKIRNVDEPTWDWFRRYADKLDIVMGVLLSKWLKEKRARIEGKK